jgi:hypothetical protein
MQQQQQQQQGRPPAEAPVEPSVLESRQAQLQAAPLHWFQAVGVSFDGRQGLIAQLNQGEMNILDSYYRHVCLLTALPWPWPFPDALRSCAARPTLPCFRPPPPRTPWPQAGQAVAFVREPDNPHDPHAVSVRTLDDKKLGYIARDETQHFPQASAGAASWLTELCYRADS